MDSPYLKRAIHIDAVACDDVGRAEGRHALSRWALRPTGVVSRRCGVPGLLGLAAVAGRVRLSSLRKRGRVAAGRRAVLLRWLQASGQRDRGHDLSWHPHPVDGVVRGRMADDDLEVGHQRAELAPGTRSGQLPDVVGDAAPLPRCDGRASARQTLWRSGDGRNVHRRGQARQAIIASAKSDALREFITANIAPGSIVISDALSSYPNALAGPDYEHDPINIKRSGLQAHQLLPGVHRLFSLSKRWLEGTHQGAVEGDHLQSYLDEFIFRFNRRTARQRGLLFLRLLERAVEAKPIRYLDIVANPRPADRPHRPPGVGDDVE